jgi:hypothetical protein
MNRVDRAHVVRALAINHDAMIRLTHGNGTVED